MSKETAIAIAAAAFVLGYWLAKRAPATSAAQASSTAASAAQQQPNAWMPGQWMT